MNDMNVETKTSTTTSSDGTTTTTKTTTTINSDGTTTTKIDSGSSSFDFALDNLSGVYGDLDL